MSPGLFTLRNGRVLRQGNDDCEGTLARSLLSSAIDEADPDPVNVVELLDGIDGAFERAQLGLRQASAGETVALDDL